MCVLCRGCLRACQQRPRLQNPRQRRDKSRQMARYACLCAGVRPLLALRCGPQDVDGAPCEWMETPSLVRKSNFTSNVRCFGGKTTKTDDSRGLNLRLRWVRKANPVHTGTHPIRTPGADPQALHNVNARDKWHMNSMQAPNIPCTKPCPSPPPTHYLLPPWCVGGFDAVVNRPDCQVPLRRHSHIITQAGMPLPHSCTATGASSSCGMSSDSPKTVPKAWPLHVG